MDLHEATKSCATVSKISEHAQYRLLHKTTWFRFISATEKKVHLAWTFFQSLVNDDVKVNKYKESLVNDTKLIIWILMQLISQSEI